MDREIKKSTKMPWRISPSIGYFEFKGCLSEEENTISVFTIVNPLNIDYINEILQKYKYKVEDILNDIDSSITENLFLETRTIELCFSGVYKINTYSNSIVYDNKLLTRFDETELPGNYEYLCRDYKIYDKICLKNILETKTVAYSGFYEVKNSVALTNSSSNHYIIIGHDNIIEVVCKKVSYVPLF